MIYFLLFFFWGSYYVWFLNLLLLLLADELGDFAAELKLSLFQLGVGPQIMASIIMQVYGLLLLFGQLIDIC